ncbi:MAG: hypothetical protein ACK56I_13900, partial [bacterium]
MVRQAREAAGRSLRLDRPAVAQHVDDAAVGKFATAVGPLLEWRHRPEHAPLLREAGRMNRLTNRRRQRSCPPRRAVVQEAHGGQNGREDAGPACRGRSA